MTNNNQNDVSPPPPPREPDPRHASQQQPPQSSPPQYQQPQPYQEPQYQQQYQQPQYAPRQGNLSARDRMQSQFRQVEFNPLNTASNQVYNPDGGSMVAAVAAHLSNYLFTIGIIPQLIIYMLSQDKNGFASRNAAAAFDFQLSMIIWGLVCSLVSFVTFGLGAIVALPFLFILFIGAFAFPIFGLIYTAQGRVYDYPFTFKMLSK